MALTWPATARIGLSGHRLGWRADVQRVAFDDGAARQARRGRGLMRTIDLTIYLEDDSGRTQFEAWVAQLGDDWLLTPAWLVPEGAPRRARIVGGRAGVQWTSEAHPGGRRTWRARLQLESPEDRQARDLWDPLLPLGAMSGVYARATGDMRVRSSSHPGPGFELNLPVPSPPARLPAQWGQDPAVALYLQTFKLFRWLTTRRGINYSLEFSAAPAVPGWRPGPNLRTGVLPDLALCMRDADARTLVVRGVGGSPADTTEPYIWRASATALGAHDAFCDLFLPSGGVVQSALVWIGAGSPVDLATLRSDPGGAG